jgi:hypothetical protein
VQTTFTQSITDTVLNINIGASIGTFTGKVLNRVYISEIHNIIQENGYVFLNGQTLMERFNYNDLRQNGNGYFYDSLGSRLYIQTLTDADSNYQIVVSDIKITNMNNMDDNLPENYGIEQNYPNPFNPTTTIKYSLPTESRVLIRVYNMLGQVVATLSDEIQNAGYKSVEWNANTVSSGIYFYHFDEISDLYDVFIMHTCSMRLKIV